MSRFRHDNTKAVGQHLIGFEGKKSNNRTIRDSSTSEYIFTENLRRTRYEH